MRDSEDQLFRQPASRQSFLSSRFHRSFSSYTSSSVSSISSLTLSSCGSSSRSSIDDNIAKIITRSRHEPISSVQSAGPSRIPTADKTRDKSQPGVTPPKVHRAILSIENKSLNFPATRGYVFSPSVEDHPIRPARTRSHLRTSFNYYASSKTYTSSGLD